jgi:four helix bundle protein
MKPAKTISERSFEFVLKIIALYKNLEDNKEYVLSRQLLRAGTSIGANIEEAQAVQSKKDFISKMSIASKEARETYYWLKLLHRSKIVNIDYSTYLSEIENIINILTKIVKTAQQNASTSNT